LAPGNFFSFFVFAGSVGGMNLAPVPVGPGDYTGIWIRVILLKGGLIPDTANLG